VTGNSLSPSFYMMLTAGLSIVALVFVRRRRYPIIEPHVEIASSLRSSQ
jgi:hypothetical protein